MSVTYVDITYTACSPLGSVGASYNLIKARAIFLSIFSMYQCTFIFPSGVYLQSAIGSATSSPSRSRPTSPTQLRSAAPHWTSSAKPRPSADEQRTLAASAAKPTPSPRRSFLPNFSKVVRSPLKKASHGLKAQPGTEKETVLPAAAPHKSIQNRTFTATSSKSSSSSSSSSSASSKDSVMTVIPAPRNKGAKWFMRHFVGSRGKLSAV